MSVINFPTTVSGLNTIVNGTSALALDSVSAYETAVGAGEIVQFTGGLSAVSSTVQGETAMVAMTPTVAETGAVNLVTAGTVASLTPLQVFGACAAAFGIGFTGGVGIAEVVDELDPNFWYNFYDGLNKKFGKVKALFKNGVSYLPMDVLEYSRNYFQQSGVFEMSGYQPPIDPTQMIKGEFYPITPMNKSEFRTMLFRLGSRSFPTKIYGKTYYIDVTAQDYVDAFDFIKDQIPDNTLMYASYFDVDVFVDEETSTITKIDKYITLGYVIGYSGSTEYSIGRSEYDYIKPLFYFPISIGHRNEGGLVTQTSDSTQLTNYFIVKNGSSIYKSKTVQSNFKKTGIPTYLEGVASADLYGSSFCIGSGEIVEPVQGLEKNPDEVQPKPEPLPQPETYPNWNPIQIPTVVPDTSPLPEIPYYPVKVPEPDVQPNQQEAQNGAIDDGVVQDTARDAVDDAVDKGLNNPEPKPPVTPTPILPIVPPSTSPIGLHALYVPSSTQLQAFNDYLWGNDFFDNVKKLFQDPMQGIISLHKVYFSPTIKGNTSIVIGKQNTGVNSDYTETQYYEIDCGTVKIEEFFNDVRDYKGYTSIQLYLPFIGIEEVNVNDLMNKNVNITYKIDILTGNCVAIISAETFSGVNQILYIFNGNCSETVPISGSNYSSILMSSLSVVGAVVGTVASDGLLAPTLLSSGASLGKQLGHTIQRSGSIGGNFGALSPKKPYIIINRSVAYDAYNYQDLYGFPANKTISLGVCSGYTRVKSVHVEGIVCTDEEKDMIEQQLMKGVIV